jgi:hypothetical protein
MDGRALDFVALGIFITVLITFLYAIIYIHDIPYEIAKKRNHPHQDAIHTAGWVSLFLMHALWPFLWIWATLYKPDRGWGMLTNDGTGNTAPPEDPVQELIKLKARVAALEEKLKPLAEPETTTPVEEA